jgi:membrane-associated protein
MGLIATPLELVTGSPWAYAVITGSIAGSAVFPPLPSESMLVAAAGLAVAGQLDLLGVAVATTVGALVGDLLAYALGRSISSVARGRAARSARGRAALEWLDEHEASWGPGLVVLGRFVPGGTTAVGVAAGILPYPLRRFLLFAALGAVLWTGYGLGLALLGRAVFPSTTWAGVLLAVGIALGVGAALQTVRRRRRRPPRRR